MSFTIEFLTTAWITLDSLNGQSVADYTVDATGTVFQVSPPVYSYGSAITGLGHVQYTITPTPSIDFIVDPNVISIATTERQVN